MNEKRMKISWKDKKLWLWFGLLLAVFAAALRHLEDVRDGAVESGDYWLITDYRNLFIGVLIVLAAAGWCMFLSKRWNLEKTFAVCILGLGFLYMCVLPPLSAPDEVGHYITAYKLSNQMMGKTATEEHGLVYIRREDAFIEDLYNAIEHGEDDPNKRVVLGQTVTEDTYRQFHDRSLAGITAEGTEVSNIWTVRTTPLAYVPQALGFTIARLLSLSGIGLLFMGRFMNLLFYVGVTYLAMRKIPFCREVLFGVSLLPMTLHLVSSLSYDVMILALAGYFTAYTLHLAYEKERVSVKDVAVLAVVAMILVPCKIVYGTLLGLCFLIPVKKFGGWKRYLLSALAVAAVTAASVYLVNSQVIATYTAESSSFVEWAEEPGYTFSQVLTNQKLVLNMIYNTIVWQSEHYFVTMLGGALGNLDQVLDVPFALLLALGSCLLGLSFRKPGENLYFSRRQKLWVSVLILGCVVAVLLSMMVTYTPLTSKIISGVQGRYFLPILPLLLIILKNNRVVLTGNYDKTLLYLMCCANGYVLLRLFGIVSMRL